MIPQTPDTLRDTARRLGLYGLLANWTTVAHEDWLPRLLEYEAHERQRRSLENRIKQARIGTFKPMADFDWRWPKTIDRQAIEELFSFEFVAEAASGSTSVLWAVLFGIGVAGTLSLLDGSLDLGGLSRVGLKGAGALTGMALVLWLALTLGEVTRSLGTGEYAAGVVGDGVPLFLLLPLVFMVTGGIAFATGSSWGTFAIMLAVAIPLSNALELPPAPFVAAVLSGGIFGDHCSPISDTTIIASLASGTDHIEHVRTQLPYALTAGGIAAVGFAIVGAVV